MDFVTIGTGRIEYERIDIANAVGPTIVMLHEGLGSVSMWKDFPQQLAYATRQPIVAYSRHGHGRSERLHVQRTSNYMHDEALVVLPQLLEYWGVANPILFGHSDGASIALIYAGGSGRVVTGIVALAPHTMVENISIVGIEAAKRAYETTSLRERLAHYHEDVDGVFWGWNNIWLSPAFRPWNIEAYLPRICSPILAIQGAQDEYGTMDQIERIRRAKGDVEVLELEDCRHSPHRDQPDVVLNAVVGWMNRGGHARSSAILMPAAARNSG